MFDWISNIFKPAADLVDNVHTSTEEKMQLKNKFAEIQTELSSKIMELELAKIKAQSEVMKAEATSTNLLTSSWRPAVSVLLVGLIIADSFEWVALKPAVFELTQYFLGFYASGRSLEKVISVSKLGK